MASLAREGTTSSSAQASCSRRDEHVAEQFPNTKFAITDYSVTARLQRKHKNIEGLTYATQQNSYLVGCLAAHGRRKGGKIISVVGGRQDPAGRHVPRRLSGWREEVRSGHRGAPIGYSQDFLDQAKCKTIAQNQIDAGSQVEFNVAGPCGLGALEAAKEAGAGASASN